MNIALVTETFPPEVNGVAMTLRRLVEGGAARGETITVVRPRQKADRDAASRRSRAGLPSDVTRRVSGGTISDALPYREWLMPGIALPRYEGLMIGLPDLGRLWWRLRRLQPDVVHVATEGPLGWSALAAARHLGLPISSSFHTNFHQYGKHYGYGSLIQVAVGYLRYFHNLAQLTMVPTRQMRDELAAENFRNLAVVSRGVDTQLFDPTRRSEELRRSWGVAPGDPVFLYVGRLAREKNIDLAVASFLAARSRLPRAHFVLVGDGPEGGALRKRYPDFHFAGLRHGADLAAHYASGDVFLFPSVTETFGNVVTEALGSGLVVVTYDGAAGREHIRSGENGLLVRFNDPAAYRAAVVDIAARPADWPRLRAAARATALTVTWDTIIDRFLEQLRGVAATRSQGRRAV